MRRPALARGGRGDVEGEGKHLLGPEGERYLEAAHDAGVGSLWLVENHNMACEDVDLLTEYADEVNAKPVDHLLYYYFPRNLADPEANMETVAECLLA